MKLKQLCSRYFKNHKNDKQRIHFRYDFLNKWHTTFMFCKTENVYKIIRLLPPYLTKKNFCQTIYSGVLL